MDTAQPSTTTPTTPAPETPVAPAPSIPSQPQQAAPVTSPVQPPSQPAVPPTPPTPPSGMPTTPTPPPPLTPPQPKKRGLNMWLVLGILVLIILLGAGIYFLAKTQLSNQSVTQMPTPVPQVEATTPTPFASPTASLTNETGTVSGKLCYPSSMIPAGTITAKSTTTNKEFTKPYAGTQNGGGTTYTMDLTPDTYHMKFTPTQYSSVIGFYTDYSSCVGNPSSPNCSGQKVRPLLTVDIKAGATVSDVNLCDYYYPAGTPPQF